LQRRCCKAPDTSI